MWGKPLPLTRDLILASTKAGNFTFVLCAIKNSSAATACTRWGINHTQSRSAFHRKFSVNTQDLRHEREPLKKKKSNKLCRNKFHRRFDDARSCCLPLQRSIWREIRGKKNSARWRFSLFCRIFRHANRYSTWIFFFTLSFFLNILKLLIYMQQR